MASKLIIINKYSTPFSSPSLSSSTLHTASRRKLHESAYEKEVEDEVEVEVEAFPVEDISHKPEEYWRPDPETGVFVPAAEQNSEEPAVTLTTDETVLDEHAFFRQKENIEAPLPELFTCEIPPVDPFAE